jgi:hypothetical protein
MKEHHGFGVKISWIRGQNTMGRMIKIPRINGSKYYEYGIDTSWVGRSQYHG